MRYTVSGAWLCHTGKVRRQNEDSCLAVGVLSEVSDAVPALVARPSGPWIVAVADGIGGHVAGHEASRAVVEALADCSRVTPVLLRNTLRQLNRDLCDHGRRDSAFAGMGTTVAGIGCGSTGLFAFHVGDSRVYRVDKMKLTQLTRDDSEAEELIEMGLLPADAEIRPGYLHALTQAVGGRLEHVEIEVHTQPLKATESTRFLICTDGLTDMVARPAIEEITKLMRAPDVTAEALFGLAMDAGGLDNITLAIIDVEPLPRPPRGSAQS
ncbi:MAG: protein phosphatase 2C domain-containing protein [Chthoniobacteraceae bacterium]